MARSNEEPNARSVAATEREKRRAAERLDAKAKEDPGRGAAPARQRPVTARARSGARRAVADADAARRRGWLAVAVVCSFDCSDGAVRRGLRAG